MNWCIQAQNKSRMDGLYSWPMPEKISTCSLSDS